MTILLEEQAILDQLMHSPRLPIIVRKLEQVVADEAAQRQAFYDQITEGDKAEYINGEIIFHSPVKFCHLRTTKRLLVLLDTHVGFNDLGFVGYEKMLISLTRNDYEPDICYFSSDKAAQFTEEQMRFPAPDFIVEVLLDSTEGNDRGVKFKDYAAHGVQEYWIIDPVREMVEQYQLVQDRYELRIKSDSGEIKSVVLPDFQIPVRAIFDDDLNRKTLVTLTRIA